MASSERYSFRDFTGHDLTTMIDMSGIVIEGSCFSHEEPDSVVFPPSMTGTTFIDCNLDNCAIPPGNTVIRGSERRFKVQNDLNDWEIDGSNKAVRPVFWQVFVKYGLPLPKPEDIPKDFLRTEVLLQADYDRDKLTPAFQSWYFETPIVTASDTKTLEKDVTPDEWDRMVAESDWFPFTIKPESKVIEVKTKDKDGNVVVVKVVKLTGTVGTCTIQGKGKIKGGVGYRPYVNVPVKFLPDTLPPLSGG